MSPLGHQHSKLTRIKLSEQKIGPKNPQWQGGRTSDGHGYLKLRIEPRKYQLEHRYIMEQHLGRKLSPHEHVHHINGLKNDNRLENLTVMTKNEHHRYHSIKYYGCSVDGCDRNHRAKGMCVYHYNKQLRSEG